MEHKSTQSTNSSAWTDLIKRALAEDIGPGDHSSNCSIPAEALGKMQLLVKEKGVLAGVAAAEQVFQEVDPTLVLEKKINDGSAVRVGDIAFTVHGPVRSLLRGERLALNIMQRMSGIASYTRQLVDQISHTKTRLLDTRKTTPGLRFMEKEAVRLGGGMNHRMGLYDMIMLKDNHVDFAGGISAAIAKAQQYLKSQGLAIPIEVETRNFKEIEETLQAGGVQRIMFDNFSVADCRKAVDMCAGAVETEASGGITEETLTAYAETGVDYISVGALTHSVSGLDMSLKAY